MAFNPKYAVDPDMLTPASDFDPNRAIPMEDYEETAPVREDYKETAPVANSLAEAMAATPYGRFAAGFNKGLLLTPAKAVVNLGAKALENVGLLNEEQMQALSEKEKALSQQYEEKLQPSGAGEFVGTMAIPMPGKKIEAAGKVAKALQRVGQGALYGGMTEAANADVASEDYGGRVAGGAALGGITAPIAGIAIEKSLKGLAALANKGYNFAGKTVPDILSALGMGSKKLSTVYSATERKPAEVAAALRKVEKYGVEGYKETAASKTARMRQSILPAAESKLVAEESTEYARRKLGNIEALRRALGHIAKSPVAREKAVQARKDASQPYFKQFEKTVFDSDPDLDWFLSTPAGRQAAARADRNVKNIRDAVGRIRVEPKPEDIVAGGAAPEKYQYTGLWLDNVRKSLKSMISEGAKRGMEAEERNTLIQLKDSYTKHLEDLAPDTFGKGMQTFRELSRPINAMDVGVELQKALSATETGASARSFTKALSDVPKLLRKSTGDSRFTKLNQVLDKDQMALVYGVQDKLAKEELLKAMSSFGSKAEDVVRPKDNAWINFLNPIITAAHSIRSITNKAISDKAAKELAVELLYPEQFAKVLDQAILAEKAQSALYKGSQKAGGATAQSYLDWQRKPKSLEDLNEKYQ